MLKIMNVKKSCSVLLLSSPESFFLDKSDRFGLSSQISVLIGKVINNHRMLRWEVQEGTSGDHLIHPPKSQQGQLEHVVQGHVQPGFKYFRDGKTPQSAWTKLFMLGHP